MSTGETKYTLHYFKIKGRAEPIRLIFAVSGIQFEDVGIEKSEWQTLKPKFPWGQVPVLEVVEPNGDKIVLAQTNAICRFLSRRSNLNGADAVNEAKCNELVDAVNDYMLEWKKMFHLPESDPRRSEIREACLKIHTPNYLDKFSRIKEKNAGKWFVGAKTTWADLYIFAMLSSLEERATPQLLENYPLLQQFQKEVSNITSIKKFTSTRRFP